MVKVIKTTVIAWLVLCNSGLLAKTPMFSRPDRFSLNGPDWKLGRCLDISDEGPAISRPGYNDSAWTPGKVPGTVLTSFLDTGLLPDPNYGDGQLSIPDDYFTADFWYRKEFCVPERMAGKRIWLHLDGINWKAEIYLNGRFLHLTEGAYRRTDLDITEVLAPQGVNALAVHIHINDHPGEVTVQHLNDPDGNGGIIGLDSPTVLASIGWNWMPTIRGRNIGVCNDVYLTASGDVTLSDTFIKTDLNLPDTTVVDLSLEVRTTNHSGIRKKGMLEAVIAGRTVRIPVELQPHSSKKVRLTSREHRELRLENPRLWWPNGYGEQNMYEIKVSFFENGVLSDSEDIDFGMREYSYLIDNDNLRLLVNGRPVIVRGGNWGMSESMLRCDSLGYDLRVRLHKEMNLNMIRNWIGMTGDDEFYDACDRYGIMVWDDFWLANPVDGPHPADEKMFTDCAEDKILHFRNHPSIAIWCGRNEGFPPARLDSAMRRMTHELDGTRYYIPHSAASPVSGLGPYENKSPRWYFENRGLTFHSEQGIVVPPTYEGFKAMMPESSLWPVNDMWGLHDWTQERVSIFYDDMVGHYGPPKDIKDFCRKAQMMNMESCKAIMEAWQSRRGPGVLVWMSHPAWPSLICQTYDYFFEPTAAFFAFKTACEPVHILWRADNDAVEAVNDTFSGLKDLEAELTMTDLDGREIRKQAFPVYLPPDSVTEVCRLDPSDCTNPVSLLFLTLKDAAGKVISRNFYWRGNVSMDYRSMDGMPEAEVRVRARKQDGNTMDCTIRNTGDVPAVMLRLILLDRETGERVLPAHYQDNYFSLLPGESRSIHITWEADKPLPGRPDLFVEGWNLSRRKTN